MPHIILTEEQARVVAEARGPVEVRDPQGRGLATLRPHTDVDRELIAQAKRNRADPRPRIPSAQVQAHLRRLEEIRQSEGLDEARMMELLRRMQAGEEV